MSNLPGVILLHHRIEIRIRLVGVEHLVAVHYGNEVLGVGEVDDVMRIAREHMHNLDVVAGDFPFQDLAFRIIEVALLDEAVALDDNELFELGVVPVLPLGDSGLADVDRNLAGVMCMHEFREGTAVIHIHLQRERGLLVRQVA